MIEENGRRKHVVPTPLTPEMDKSLQFNPNLCSNNVSIHCELCLTHVWAQIKDRYVN
jgi:hypothetical protein